MAHDPSMHSFLVNMETNWPILETSHQSQPCLVLFTTRFYIWQTDSYVQKDRLCKNGWIRISTTTKNGSSIIQKHTSEVSQFNKTFHFAFNIFLNSKFGQLIKFTIFICIIPYATLKYKFNVLENYHWILTKNSELIVTFNNAKKYNISYLLCSKIRARWKTHFPNLYYKMSLFLPKYIDKVEVDASSA